MNYTVIEDIKDLGNFLIDLSISPELGVDVETSSLDPLTCILYSVQISTRNHIYLFDMFHFKNLSYLVQLLEDKTLVGHNIKYDISVLYRYTGVVLRNLFDTQLAEVLISPNPRVRYYALDELVFNYFGIVLDKSVREFFYKNGILTELTQQQIIYAVEDVQYLLPLKDIQYAEIVRSKQTRVWDDIECKLESTTMKSEMTGVLMDTVEWKKLMEENRAESKIVKGRAVDIVIERTADVQFNNLLEMADKFLIKDVAKTKRDRTALEQITDPDTCKLWLKANLNLGSHAQLKNALNMIGIPVESTGEEVLEDLHSDDEIIKSILTYRGLDTLVGTFGQSFLDSISPVDGRLHYTLNQMGARSGRYSGSEPNMQNIPRDNRYRHCFIAQNGYVFICLDFNQEEYRLAGAVTGDPTIIKAYQDGLDMHIITASILYNVSVREVSKLQRQEAKSANFAILYGSTEYGLAYNFKISVQEGLEILNKFRKTYPVFVEMREVYEAAIVRAGYACTLTGRRRYFPKPERFENGRGKGSYEKWVATTKREGFNTIIQGTGADIIKLSQIKIDYENPFYKPLTVLYPVHDEIVVEAEQSIGLDAYEFVKNCMLVEEQKFLGPIPAKVEGPENKLTSRWEH